VIKGEDYPQNNKDRYLKINNEKAIILKELILKQLKRRLNFFNEKAQLEIMKRIIRAVQ